MKNISLSLLRIMLFFCMTCVSAASASAYTAQTSLHPVNSVTHNNTLITPGMTDALRLQLNQKLKILYHSKNMNWAFLNYYQYTDSIF